MFALIRPRTNTLEDIVHLPATDWTKRTVSVCRAKYATFELFYNNVVVGQISKPGWSYEGYVWAKCEDIRNIEVLTRKGERTGIGAVCVLDHPLDAFEAHAHMGECRPSENFWEKNNRQAVKLNVCLLFERNGVQLVSGYPFEQ